ncbi:MAG TPA: hypothetical protein VNI84_15875 [Pyrinomonadaceae bacterium]|nr:hypothetical protein [Pyrinomonadaceae bacterium]
MMNKTRRKQFLSMAFAAVGFVLISGASAEVSAQRDPFEKSPLTKPRVYNPNPAAGRVKVEKPKPAGPPPVVALGAPPIQQRIDYYMRMREDAANRGLDVKVTSVLTLDELSVTGIFRTPRGYAAMVQAKPINLSYTIYPGEKFFDGQLVAVEENQLVFRKVTKMSNGKFTAAVENKTLRQYTLKEEVQGTAPVQTAVKSEPTASTEPQPPSENTSVALPPVQVTIISPLEEMMRQPPPPPDKPKAAAKDKNVKKGKKAVKVADNKKQR